MDLSLSVCFSTAGYSVVESADYLLVGFRVGAVDMLVKEVWNTSPLTRQDMAGYYAELSEVGKRYGCCYFRIVSHGGFLKEALEYELYGLTVSDETYLESLVSGRHVELFPHNEAAYRAIEQGFASHRIGTVVQATGTGKSYLIARYISRHPRERILVIAPGITILDEIRRAVGFPAAGVEYMTFQALTRRRGLNEIHKVDHILIDEFHHFGAEVWGDALQELIEENPEAYVLGTSATPVRPEGMIDTVDLYFEGNLFYELTLPQAWYYGILPVPVLVQSAYGLDGELNRLQRKLDRSSCSDRHRRKIQKKLDAARIDFNGALGVSEVIRKFLPESVHKLLVFCRDFSHLKEMKPKVNNWLTEAGYRTCVFEIHHGKSEKENRKTLEDFRETTDKLHLLFSINMLIEGLHVEGVDAVLFLRRTESYIVTLQQLGRCLNAGAGRNPVVLDFVNNLSGKSVYDVMTTDLEKLSRVPSPEGFEKIVDFKTMGFLSDIRLRVEEILAELEPWQVMYERLVDFHDKEQDWPSVTEGKLGLWCNTQRVAYKQGKLPEERILLLDTIGFEWSQQDSRWMQGYQALKTFLDTNGCWPKRKDGTVACWCFTQREMRKSGKLTKERIRKLDEIGFIWSQDLETEWTKTYEKLKRFLAQHNRFPKSSEGQLGEWCSTQRKMRRQNRISEERVELLDEIGFIWSPDQLWQENLQSVCNFYREYGRWPYCREGSLGCWCAVQRRDYKNGKLTEERKTRLKEAGFC